MKHTIYHGDTLKVLKTLPDESVDCIITSPPYWGLRDYGIDGQIGLESTLEEYLNEMLQITAELNRVLKKTGVMFWNHGDCYQDKSLAMQNYRLILKMLDQQGDKWYLRNIIIWAKPNHMPSSVKDRFTNAYEPVFMLTRSKKYWFDLDAVRVPHKSGEANSWEEYYKKLGKSWHNHSKDLEIGAGQKEVQAKHPLGKNLGDLWTIPTQPFPEAHFATFPEKLIEPMIKAGCPQWICKKCGKARVRIIEEKRMTTPRNRKDVGEIGKPSGIRSLSGNTYNYPERQTIGWTDCKCREGWKAGVVLDPFLGSGTTMVVAEKLNRNSIGIELNPDYIEIAKKRMKPFLGQMRINGERTELKIVEAIKNER